MIDPLIQLFGQVQQVLFEAAVQPLVFALGGASILEDAYDATGWLLVGLLQLAVLLGVIGPLERWRPIEPVTDRAAIRTDVIYTLLDRLGLFRVALFFAVDPLWDALWGTLALHGISGWQLDAVVAPWLPGWSDTPLVSFAVYLLAFDLFDYAYHRAEHRFNPWWALHAVHHSQRQMTMWTDSRNHLLDDLLRDVLLVQLGHLIGVPPGQFVAVVAFTKLVENVSHANARISFGRWGERLLVSPRFHRFHHGIGVGHEGLGTGTLGGCNFAVLFPVWDVLFGTARFDTPMRVTTGIRDQLPEHGGRDYGGGFWAQQRLGLLRLLRRA